MRLAIVREALYLPAMSVQHKALLDYGYDELREDRGSDFVADRRIQRLIAAQRSGDEMVVYSLGVLTRPHGRPARVIRDVLEAGLVLTIVSIDGGPMSFPASSHALALVTALADHERGRNVSPTKSVHQGGSRNRLSKYQVEYARKLYAEGNP